MLFPTKERAAAYERDIFSNTRSSTYTSSLLVGRSVEVSNCKASRLASLCKSHLPIYICCFVFCICPHISKPQTTPRHKPQTTNHDKYQMTNQLNLAIIVLELTYCKVARRTETRVQLVTERYDSPTKEKQTLEIQSCKMSQCKKLADSG